jgi:hypothetical protein
MRSISTPNPSELSSESPRRLRAIVEIVNGELVVYPVADSDVEAATILDALRFVIEDGKRAAA